MTHPGWFTEIRTQRPAGNWIAGGLCAAVLFAASAAGAQVQTPGAPLPPPAATMSVPNGYTAHSSVDFGGRIADTTGSDAMYDTLVNLQSGPRVMGESFELRALPGTKHTLVDNLSAFSSGFGGDPNIFARMNFYKGKLYEFSGLFRRNRQYFDYDLLGNPNIPGGQSMPIGPASNPSGSVAWPQALESPVMFNTVRRMTDTRLTFLPVSKITYRFGYSQNIFQGPSLSPGESIGGTSPILLEEFMRQSSDDWTGSVEWKPVNGTLIAFDELVDHIKSDSFFTLAPQSLFLQEADGTRVSIGDYTSQTPYTISSCNKNSLASSTTFLYAAQTPGALPVIDPACDVTTSYQRYQPTRFLYPTEAVRLQSSTIPHLTMNGHASYTQASINMPNYYENWAGLSGTSRSIVYTGPSSGHRTVIAVDYGVLWQAAKTVTVAEQINYSNVHQPGISSISSGVTLTTPATAGNETVTYSGPLLTAAKPTTIEGNPNGTPTPDYFGQKLITNNLTVSWDATARTTFNLTWRHTAHTIAEGIPYDAPLAVGATSNGYVKINENGVIASVAVRPASNWTLNGSVEGAYADNAFTPMTPRQLWHYKVRSMYKPRPWATISGAYNDLERHNNTNNNASAVAAGLDPYEGPLDHVDHSRIVSMGAALAPNEHYSLDLSYAYSDVYSATNICYDNGATATLPGTASLNAAGQPNVCPGVYARGSTTQLADWYAREYMDAPTQYGSAALHLTPAKTLNGNLGYRIGAVNGSRFFNDARDVNGSLNSTYHSPFVNLAWTFHPGWTWKAGYDFYGYGEGGPSGPEYCSTSTSLQSAVVPCASLPYPTGRTESPAGLTAPRNFHSNTVTLGMHYEF
jgi:hypothetical protein